MTTTVLVKLSHVECANCGMVFGVTEDYEERRRRDHKTFWCPGGHSNHWSDESDLERERRLNRRANDSLARERARRDQAEASLRTTKGVVTKLKKRVAAGTCPCCNRTFQQLARHMENKHPDYVAA